MRDDKWTRLAYGGTFLINTLTIIFIILKLCDVVNWSWIWVFSPIWIVCTISMIIALSYAIFDK